jgi:hypothetical protein
VRGRMQEGSQAWALLAVSPNENAAVILKASEDIQLPIQAVDYWLRVRRHQREGNFPRHGYFAGIELDPKPPMVWPVAPGTAIPRSHRQITEISFP